LFFFLIFFFFFCTSAPAVSFTRATSVARRPYQDSAQKTAPLSGQGRRRIGRGK
jgi:hypothetical protein